ncbi:hypothetical protein HDU97_007165 [Phlyctochytrium planicorne]|nr:hypothetical protein HDU97_007165 [Phlyctochytrium planicorne]
MKFTLALTTTAALLTLVSAYPATQPQTSGPTINGIPYTTDLTRNPDNTFTAIFTATAHSHSDCESIRTFASNDRKIGFCDGLKLEDEKTGKRYFDECVYGFNHKSDDCIYSFDMSTTPYTFTYTYTGHVIAKSLDHEVTYPNIPSTHRIQPQYNKPRNAIEFKTASTSRSDCSTIEHLVLTETKFCDGLPTERRGQDIMSADEMCRDKIHAIRGFCERSFDEGKPEFEFYMWLKASLYPEWAKRFS